MNDPKTVLIIDDEAVMINLIKIELEFHGFKVHTANDGKLALDAVKANRPDLILLDVMMPIMDGYETCKILKTDPDFKEIPVILLTARGHASDIEKGTAAGADGHIIKPFDGELLVEEIKKKLRME